MIQQLGNVSCTWQLRQALINNVQAGPKFQESVKTIALEICALGASTQLPEIDVTLEENTTCNFTLQRKPWADPIFRPQNREYATRPTVELKWLRVGSEPITSNILPLFHAPRIIQVDSNAEFVFWKGISVGLYLPRDFVCCFVSVNCWSTCRKFYGIFLDDSTPRKIMESDEMNFKQKIVLLKLII